MFRRTNSPPFLLDTHPPYTQNHLQSTKKHARTHVRACRETPPHKHGPRSTEPGSGDFRGRLRASQGSLRPARNLPRSTTPKRETPRFANPSHTLKQATSPKPPRPATEIHAPKSKLPAPCPRPGGWAVGGSEPGCGGGWGDIMGVSGRGGGALTWGFVIIPLPVPAYSCINGPAGGARQLIRADS